MFDSDLSTGTKYRDALLFSLTLYDVNNGKNRLRSPSLFSPSSPCRELYAAVPGIRKSLLGVHAKQFGEKFHHMQVSLLSPTTLPEKTQQTCIQDFSQREFRVIR